MNFVFRYHERVSRCGSILCVGLDPTKEHVPPSFGSGLGALEDYLRKVIEIAARKVAVVKPQFAYFAAYGTEGINLLIRIIRYAQERNLLVILDAKRADIGPTMAAYGEEVFGRYNADACTFVPYLGGTFMPSKREEQVWLPYLAEGRMAISMIRTSNPEAARLQDMRLADGRLVYEFIAQEVRNWNRIVRGLTMNQGCVGGVVGATVPAQAVQCREIAGDQVFFLIPGYGAQGGGAAGAVTGLRDSRGRLVGTVNSSRALTQTSWYDPETRTARKGDPLDLIERAIDAANADLNSALAALV